MLWSSRKIDSRNQLFGHMTYQVKCSLPGFFEAREWCWTNLGPGIEYDHYLNYMACLDLPGFSLTRPAWAWDASKYQGSPLKDGKIYLSTEEDMVRFSLRWS